MLKHINIGKKLLISFIAITIISGSSGIAGLAWLSSSNKQYKAALTENGFIQGDIGKFNSALNEDGGIVRDIVFLKGIFEITKSKQSLDAIRASMDESFSLIEKNCTTSAELEQLEIIKTNLPLYREKCAEVIDLGRADKDDEAMAIFREEVSPHLTACTGAAATLLEVNTNIGNATSLELQNKATLANIVVISLIGIAILFALLIAAIMSRSIARPIKACAARLVALSKGDFHSPVSISFAKDETGVMLSSLRKAVDNINGAIGNATLNLNEIAKGNLSEDITLEYEGDLAPLKEFMMKIQISLSDALNKINVAADHVSDTSEQVASGAQALAQGASEQEASIEALSCAINEMTEKIKENATNARSAHDITVSSDEAIDLGNEQMKQMNLAMDEISQTSGQIEKIISTIDNIAFQTNLLALNAAVEAARAGEAGKGFSVVADEVRNLSGKSAEAAKSSTGLIGSSTFAVEKGKGIAEKTAQSLDSIVKNSKTTIGIVEEIAIASKIQTENAQSISLGINQISSIVQTNSTTAQQSSAASQELSSQAAMLKGLVRHFKLKSNMAESGAEDIQEKSYIA